MNIESVHKIIVAIGFVLDLFWMAEKWHYIKVLIILWKEISGQDGDQSIVSLSLSTFTKLFES